MDLCRARGVVVGKHTNTMMKPILFLLSLPCSSVVPWYGTSERPRFLSSRLAATDLRTVRARDTSASVRVGPPWPGSFSRGDHDAVSPPTLVHAVQWTSCVSPDRHIDWLVAAEA